MTHFVPMGQSSRSAAEKEAHMRATSSYENSGRRIPRKDGRSQEGGTVVIVSDVVSHVYLTLDKPRRGEES